MDKKLVLFLFALATVFVVGCTTSQESDLIGQVIAPGYSGKLCDFDSDKGSAAVNTAVDPNKPGYVKVLNDDLTLYARPLDTCNNATNVKEYYCSSWRGTVQYANVSCATGKTCVVGTVANVTAAFCNSTVQQPTPVTYNYTFLNTLSGRVSNGNATCACQSSNISQECTKPIYVSNTNVGNYCVDYWANYTYGPSNSTTQYNWTNVFQKTS